MKITRTILLAAAFGFFLASCNKIDAPYYTVKGGGGDTTKITRKVLLEDYTGHKCVNCPEAAITAQTLEEAYEGKLIVMAVHAGFFAIPGTGAYTADYRTTAGEEWNNTFGITSNPNGMINRKEFGGTRILGPDLWADSLAGIINLPPDATITITSTFTPYKFNHLNTTVDTKFLNDLEGTYYLSVCILEDSIISAQKNNNPNVGPTPDWYDYVFMNMLRGTLNGTWGELLVSEPDTSLVYSKTYPLDMDTAWVPKNCSVLAFVYNADTKEIIQAEKKKIMP